MISFDHGRPGAVTPLEVVRESVLHTRVDVELAYPSGEELALDRGDQRPHQAPPPVGRIDQHVE